MIGLVQRVSRASVEVDGHTLGRIDHGMLVLVGVERGDTPAEVSKLLDRLVRFRIFADPQGRMNLDIRAVAGALLLVPQFTLAADTSSGHRPGFSRAAEPSQGQALFELLVERARESGVAVETGLFGATMRVCLCNEGPATFWLHCMPTG